MFLSRCGKDHLWVDRLPWWAERMYLEEMAAEPALPVVMVDPEKIGDAPPGHTPTPRPQAAGGVGEFGVTVRRVQGVS